MRYINDRQRYNGWEDGAQPRHRQLAARSGRWVPGVGGPDGEENAVLARRERVL